MYVCLSMIREIEVLSTMEQAGSSGVAGSMEKTIASSETSKQVTTCFFVTTM